MLTGLKRPAVLICAGLICGAVLVAYGVRKLASEGDRPEASPVPAEPVQTVVATRFISRGSSIGLADVALTAGGEPPPGAIQRVDAAVGQVAATDIAARQPVLASALAASPAALGLAPLVPVGLRAISIQTNDEIAVSNLLRPGDVVDVQLVLGDALLAKGASGASADRSEAGTLLQGVKVIAVGAALTPAPATAEDDDDRPAEQVAPARTLTLAMTPQQVAEFTLARSVGAFYLALRNPADRAPTTPARVRLGDIRPAQPAPAPATVVRRVSAPARRSPPPPRGVELVVGDERRVIYPQ